MPEELAIGHRLRALRRERGLSLEGLAQVCGVSKSMLSKIERDESTPTVGAAVRIAVALAVPLARLLGVEERPRALLRPAALQEMVADPVSGTTRYQVSPASGDGSPHVERLVAPPGAASLRLPEVAAGTLLVVTVSRGRLNVTVDEQQWCLGEGDSLALRGPAAVVVDPLPGELGVAYLVSARRGSEGG